MKFLTKSLFTKGVYCPEHMWFAAHAKNELPAFTRTEVARMEQGTKVGGLAIKRHVGVRVDEEGFSEYLQVSKELLAKGVSLFEPAFAFGRQYCRVDILAPAGDEWDVIEVKSASNIKEVYLWDVAFQVDTLRKAGVSVRKAFILHINREYVRTGEIDVDKLFTKVDVSEDIEPFLAQMHKKVSLLTTVLDGKRPEIPVGPHCNSPYGCPLLSLNPLPEHNVTELYYHTGKEFIANGTTMIADIPQGVGLNKKQFVQWKAVTTQEPQVNKKRLREWVLGLKYPLYHLDFETISPAVPLFEGTRPYQRIPFQFSLHIEQADGSVEHHEYLHDGADDPRPGLVKALRVAQGEGSVLAHNASFERGVLKELLQAFPKETWITDVIARVADTIVAFRNFWYYHPSQHGSCSLKAILPALTDLSYDDLDISGGEDASLEYLRLVQEDLSEQERASLRQSLLEYCEQDTLGMIKILGALQEAVDE